MHLKIKQLESEIKQFRKNNFRLTIRLLALVELAKIQEKRRLCDSDYRLAAARFEVSSRTIYSWKKIYESKGALGLTPRLAPGKIPEAITGWRAKIIKDMRLQFNWGAEVIQAHLREHHGINITEGKIHRYLKRTGLLKTKRKSKKLKYHTRIVKVFEAGAHTQMDVKYLPHLLGNKNKCYVYNFVDHASRWQFKKAYECIGVYETIDFMRQVVRQAPFKIKRLQTDNGSEFTNKYIAIKKEHDLDIFCELHGIDKKLIPPGEKELNGLVERSHRQDDNQLFNTIKPENLSDFNKMLSDYCVWNNDYRLRRPLGWISANRYLKIWSSLIVQNKDNKLGKVA